MNVTPNSRTKKGVLVCQRGARHRYAIPRLFEEAGVLVALYTDSSIYSLGGGIARRLHAFHVRPPRVCALASRDPAGIPPEKIFSSDQLLTSALFKRADYPTLSSKFLEWGLRGADLVYSMFGEEIEFLEWAKEQGAKIVVDVFVHPGASRITAKEAVRLGMTPPEDEAYVSAIEGHFKRTFELADILLCPSGWVAEGVREYSPESQDKVRIVPYGSSLQLEEAINPNPRQGTVLFAGREPLRKGLHILAEAAGMVRKKYGEAEFRVAGLELDEARWIPQRDELTFLGSVPMSEMRNEYRQADVFVLPSFSEGQAGVLLEAMACGVPVIATRESGVDFDSDSGITVPVGDPAALAAEIIGVLESRENRDALARGALQQAARFSMDDWKRNLMEVVEGM